LLKHQLLPHRPTVLMVDGWGRRVQSYMRLLIIKIRCRWKHTRPITILK